jgi:hypothetical protein
VLAAGLHLADRLTRRREAGLEVGDHCGVVVAAAQELVVPKIEGLELGPPGDQPHGPCGTDHVTDHGLGRAACQHPSHARQPSAMALFSKYPATFTANGRC